MRWRCFALALASAACREPPPAAPSPPVKPARAPPAPAATKPAPADAGAAGEPRLERPAPGPGEVREGPSHELQLVGHTEAILAVAIDPAGARAASGGLDRSVRVWNLGGRAAAWQVGPSDEAVTALRFSPDGGLLAVGDRAYQVRLFKADGTLQLVRPHPDPVSSLSFSPDGRWLAVGGAGGNSEVYPVGEGKAVCEVRGRTVDFTDDGAYLVSAVGSGELVVTAFPSCKPRKTTSTAPHLPFGAASGRAALFATRNGAEPFVLLWDALQGRLLGKLDRQRGGVSSVSLSADGARALVASDEGQVRLYDVGTREVLQTFETRALPFAAMSADAARAVISDGLGLTAVSLAR